MLLDYWEKYRVAQLNWEQELASLGITGTEQIQVIKEIVTGKGEALVSHYHFSVPSGLRGTMTVCHDLGRGAISLGGHTRWGQWDEIFEVLTLDDTGEKFNFDGKPVYEDDEGACSLGNI